MERLEAAIAQNSTLVPKRAADASPEDAAGAASVGSVSASSTSDVAGLIAPWLGNRVNTLA